MNVGEAIARTKEIATELFGAEGIIDINLEEVAFNKKKVEWLVVVSFLRPRVENPVGSLGAALASVRARQKKLVRINANTGELIAVIDHFGTLQFQAA